MAGVAKQIIGSFEDIGKDIASEVVSVPKDIAGKALESLGTASTTKGQQGNTLLAGSADASKPKEEGALGKLNETTDPKIKQAIARAALAQLAGTPTKEKSVHERQIEEEQKKKEQKEIDTKAARMQLQPMSTKQKTGNLYGIAQKASSEKSKNARQD